jgi:hypothetical protein
MKKALILLFALMFVVSFVACGDDTEANGTTGTTGTTGGSAWKGDAYPSEGYLLVDSDKNYDFYLKVKTSAGYYVIGTNLPALTVTVGGAAATVVSNWASDNKSEVGAAYYGEIASKVSLTSADVDKALVFTSAAITLFTGTNGDTVNVGAGTWTYNLVDEMPKLTLTLTVVNGLSGGTPFDGTAALTGDFNGFGGGSPFATGQKFVFVEGAVAATAMTQGVAVGVMQYAFVTDDSWTKLDNHPGGFDNNTVNLSAETAGSAVSYRIDGSTNPWGSTKL